MPIYFSDLRGRGAGAVLKTPLELLPLAWVGERREWAHQSETTRTIESFSVL